MGREMNCVISNKKYNENGATLVEMIVAFSLFAILTMMVLMIFQPSLQIFSRNRSANDAVTVSDILMEELTGQLQGAEDISFIPVSEQDSAVIAEFTASDGRKETIYLREGRLYIGDFAFGEGAYAGFFITELSMKWEDEQAGLLRLSLTIQNPFDYVYEKTQLVKLYNIHSAVSEAVCLERNL